MDWNCQFHYVKVAIHEFLGIFRTFTNTRTINFLLIFFSVEFSVFHHACLFARNAAEKLICFENVLNCQITPLLVINAIKNLLVQF